MKKFFLAGLAAALSLTLSSPAMAASRKPNPSTQAQLNAVLKITVNRFRIDQSIEQDCGTNATAIVTFTGTIYNLTKDRTIRAVRAELTWSFVDAFQAVDIFRIEWDEVARIPPGRTYTDSGPGDWNLDCNNQAESEIDGQIGSPSLTFSYVPLEVVFTNDQRIGPPPSR
jgi:hypothetical protein